MLYIETTRNLFDNGQKILSVEPSSDDNDSIAIEFDEYVSAGPNRGLLTLDQVKQLIQFLSLTIVEIESQEE